MSSKAIYDQTLLKEQAYADDSLLDVRRRTHQIYTVDPVDFGAWTLEKIPWRGGESVLDVGCGPGGLLLGMASRRDGWRRLVGIDLSPGMAAKARRQASGVAVEFAVGDAQYLPFSTTSFDVVMARHMLYHVPNIDLAVAEAARVLRPGGRFLAVTNSAHTMPEYWALRCAAAARFPDALLPQKTPDRFALENATAFLSPYFIRMQTHTLPGTLRFPSAQPVVDYFASSRELTMRPNHTEAQWLEVLDFVRSEVEAVISSQHYFEIRKVTGAVLGFRRV